jgi:hypothetical protein
MPGAGIVSTHVPHRIGSIDKRHKRGRILLLPATEEILDAPDPSGASPSGGALPEKVAHPSREHCDERLKIVQRFKRGPKIKTAAMKGVCGTEDWTNGGSIQCKNRVSSAWRRQGAPGQKAQTQQLPKNLRWQLEACKEGVGERVTGHGMTTRRWRTW